MVKMIDNEDTIYTDEVFRKAHFTITEDLPQEGIVMCTADGTQKTAVITGITGQDGSYLAELLLNLGYRVIGIKRRSSTNTEERVAHIEGLEIVEGDITDAASMSGIMAKYMPDECYNLAAQSHVATSFDQPTATFTANAVGVLNLLEAIRTISPSTRFYQASTSEMFGDNYTERVEHPSSITAKHKVKFQDELTEFAPRSPYAVAKMAAHQLVHTYRESYGLHASCGILFNHESERRGENFVTRKITKWLGEYSHWCSQEFYTIGGLFTPEDRICWGRPVARGPDTFPKLKLGNLSACRDWGHAEDYVYAMYLMLQQDNPDDYVIATGETHSVQEFLDLAVEIAGHKGDAKHIVMVDEDLYRPAEVEYLLGDASKAREKLGWEPKTSFRELVERMVKSDMERAKNGN